jgi:hypothetical protein
MTDISEINRAIISGNFTNDQLTSIIDAVKFARAQIAQQNKYTLTIGTKVKFTNSRSGMVITGDVQKINRKFVIVKTGPLNTWRVPANMLSAA